MTTTDDLNQMTMKQVADALAAMECVRIECSGGVFVKSEGNGDIANCPCPDCVGTGAMFPSFRAECPAGVLADNPAIKHHSLESVNGGVIGGKCKCNGIGYLANPRLLHETDHVGLVIAAAEAAGYWAERELKNVDEETWTATETHQQGEWHIYDPLKDNEHYASHPDIRIALLMAPEAEAKP